MAEGTGSMKPDRCTQWHSLGNAVVIRAVQDYRSLQRRKQTGMLPAASPTKADKSNSSVLEAEAGHEAQTLKREEIDRILVLDVREQDFFTQQGYRDQHGGDRRLHMMRP